MSFFFLFAQGGPVPAPVSATVLADGVTLRVVFNNTLSAGSATLGFSRSVGTISSGTYSGVNLDLTIPKVYSGDSVGTISFNSATGTLAGVYGKVSSFGPLAITNNSTQVLWTPNSLPNILDWGIYSDLSRLKQNSDGSGAVASAGDPVGYWMGQRDNIALVQTTSANKPAYNTAGVLFNNVATQKYLASGNTGWIYSRPVAFSHDEYLITGSGLEAALVGFASSLIVIRAGRSNADSTTFRMILNSAATNIGTNLGGVVGAQRVTFSYPGSSQAGSLWLNGTKYTVNSGGGTNNFTYFTIGTQSAGGNGDFRTKGWILVDGTISDADAANIQAYWEALP